MEKLLDKMDVSQTHHSTKELIRVLGNRKEVKVSELHQLMKGYDLTSFDLEEEIMHHFFEGDKLSLSRLESVMRGLGMAPLNSKDREILIECFDFNRDKAVTKEDLYALMEVLREYNSPHKSPVD